MVILGKMAVNLKEKSYVSTIGPLFLIQYLEPSLWSGMEPLEKLSA